MGVVVVMSAQVPTQKDRFIFWYLALFFFFSLRKVCVSIRDKRGWGLTDVHHEGKRNLENQSPAAGKGQGGECALFWELFMGWLKSCVVCSGSTLWWLMHLSLLSPIVTESTQIHCYSVEKNGVIIQLNKHCCLGKKKAKKWWEKYNFFGTSWFLASQKEMKTEDSAEEQFG